MDGFIFQFGGTALHSSELAGVVAVLIAIAKLVWTFLDYALRHAKFYLGRRILNYEVDFGPIKNVPRDIEGVYCQVIRFGTDQYIERMASDQEKFEGRLQNKVLKLSARKSTSKTYIIRLRLPVHKRIGTQFKVFVRVRPKGDIEKVAAFLGELNSVSEVKPSQYKIPPKISFIINLFPTVETVDGLTNNFYYPV